MIRAVCRHHQQWILLLQCNNSLLHVRQLIVLRDVALDFFCLPLCLFCFPCHDANYILTSFVIWLDFVNKENKLDGTSMQGNNGTVLEWELHHWVLKLGQRCTIRDAACLLLVSAVSLCFSLFLPQPSGHAMSSLDFPPYPSSVQLFFTFRGLLVGRS